MRVSIAFRARCFSLIIVSIQVGRTMSPTSAPTALSSAPTAARMMSSRPPDALARISRIPVTRPTTSGRTIAAEPSGSCPTRSWRRAIAWSTCGPVGRSEARRTNPPASGGRTTTRMAMSAARVPSTATAAARTRGMNPSSASTTGSSWYAISPPTTNGRSAGQVACARSPTAASEPITTAPRPTARGVTVASRPRTIAHSRAACACAAARDVGADGLRGAGSDCRDMVSRCATGRLLRVVKRTSRRPTGDRAGSPRWTARPSAAMAPARVRRGARTPGPTRPRDADGSRRGLMIGSLDDTTVMSR